MKNPINLINVADVEKHFRDYFYKESSLVSLNYNENANLFEIIIHKGWESEEDLWRLERPFTKRTVKLDYLKFTGIENFKSKHERIKNKSGKIRYVARNPPSFLVQDVELTKMQNGWKVLFYFDSSTECEFRFASLQFARRSGFEERNLQGNWIIIDSATKEPFDFYNPFEIDIFDEK